MQNGECGVRNLCNPHSEIRNPQLRNPLWFQDLLDLLAREYGWSRSEVAELYPEEAVLLVRRIRKAEAESKLWDLNFIQFARAEDLKKAGEELLEVIRENDDHEKPPYKERFKGEIRKKLDEMDAEIEKRYGEAKRRGK